MHSELLALGSAFALALGSMFMSELKGRLDATSVVRWSFVIATLMTGTAAAVVGGWATITPKNAAYLVGSGFFAMVIAGPAYYASIFTLGAGTALLIFSLNAPIGAFAGFLLFGETFSVKEIIAVAMILSGIALAVLFGERRQNDEPRNGRAAPRRAIPWAGLGCAITAAVGQGLGVVSAKFAMADAEPFAAMTVRAVTGALILWALLVLPSQRRARHGHIDTVSLMFIVAGTAVGMGVGMTALMQALVDGDVGIVSTLGAMTPVAILPMVWVRTGVAPPVPAWIGAVIAVLGTAVLFGSGCLGEVICLG